MPAAKSLLCVRAYERHESAVAMSRHTDAFGIDKGVSRQPTNGRLDVGHLLNP